MAFDDWMQNDQDTIDLISNDGSIGPQNNGTYSYPSEAQPNNRPWDTGGGGMGQYGNDVLGILKYGVGAFANVTAQKNVLDYKRYEATQGGLFMQGRPAGYRPGQTVPGPPNNNGMFWLLIIGGAFLLMKKG